MKTKSSRFFFRAVFPLGMRITVLLLLVVQVTLGGKQGSTQQGINMRFTQSSLTDILRALKQETGYEFLYNDEEVSTISKISCDFKDASVEEILYHCLSGTSHSYKIVNNVIVIVPRNELTTQVTEQPKAIKIKGKIIDKSGESLPGVGVMVKGTTIGVATDLDGMYELTLPTIEKLILVYSFVGMKTQEIIYTGQNVIDVKLQTETAQMDEVVVTGVFTRKAESYTGSAITINQEQLKRVGNQNLFQSLRNLDPSLAISDNLDFGSDPNRMPDMELRGTSSFPATGNDLNLKGNYMNKPNQPLFILDGFEASVEKIYDLDMNRVASVTILKDASAKALYGSKAANGVIVIESKRLTSDKLRVTYNGSIDITAPDLTSYDLCNSLEKLEVEAASGYYTEERDAAHRDYLERLYNQRRKDALEGLNTYWIAKPLQTGVGYKHALSFEAGDENLRLIADISYNKVDGVVKKSGRKNLAGSLNISYRLKNFLFRNIMSITSNKSSDSPYGSFREYSQMNPYWRATDEMGNITRYAEILQLGYDQTLTIANPLYNATLNTKMDYEYLDFTNNFYAEWSIVEGLKATARIGVTAKKNSADIYFPSNHSRFRDYAQTDFFRRGSYQLNNGKTGLLSGDININYSKSINKHYLFTNIGFSMNENQYDETIHYAEGFPADKMNHIMFARQYAKDSRPMGLENTTRDCGVLGVFSYSYDNRFLSDITLRGNGSSQFGANSRWATFWSAGLGWNLHNEKFMRNLPQLTQLKLRGSVGYTGNQSFSGYQSMSTYKYYLDKSYQNFIGSYMVALANEDLKWERKLDYNVGMDAVIGRFNMRLDYYIAMTDNLLTDISLPTSTGFTTVKENLGKVKNQGFEADLSYALVRNDHGFMNLTFSVATNKNKIMEISDALKKFNNDQADKASDKQQNTPLTRYEEGKSMNAIWAVPSLGIDPATGREIYVMQNGETTYNWDAAYMQACGDETPRYRGNFGFNGEYKGIGLSVTCRYLGGGEMYNTTLVDRVENVDIYYNVDRRVLTGRWQEAGQHAQFKTLGTYYDAKLDKIVTEKTRATSRFIQRRNELDIASVSAYYDVKREWVERIGLERLKLTFNMNDLYKFSTIKVERGLDYPFARTFSFSVAATF